MRDENRVLTPGRILYTVFNLLLYPFLLLFLGGDWWWTEAWIFGILFIAYCTYTVSYLNSHSPELLRERFKKIGSAGQKGWDKYFVYALVFVFVAWFVIMPLDARRFEWTAGFSIWLKVVGCLALPPAFYLMFRAFADNPYASHLVRIQAERKQHVVSTGVYSYVRHPMYLGGMLWMLGLPLLLGSRYGLLLGVIMSLMLVGRMVGEEKVLLEELEEYEDYKRKVKYRLIRGLW